MFPLWFYKKILLPTGSVDLGALVAEIAADADFEARSRSRSVQVRQKAAVLLEGQPDLLHSAIENVVRNGVRHTAAATEVEITVHKEISGTNEYAVVSVRDYGPGVPEESLYDIFRPFFRVEDARDRQTGGSGLGLAIAARAVHLHGGAISAANVAGGGLAVTIKLPCKMPLKGKNGALPLVMKP